MAARVVCGGVHGLLPTRTVASDRQRPHRGGAGIEVGPLALSENDVVRNCEGLGQLVGLRALHITESGSDAAADVAKPGDQGTHAETSAASERWCLKTPGWFDDLEEYV